MFIYYIAEVEASIFRCDHRGPRMVAAVVIGGPTMRFPNDWPEGLAVRLGNVAILFGQIEFLLKLYVKQFLGDFERGMMVTSRMQFNQLLELTSALVKREVKSAALKKRYFDLMPRIERAQSKRNDYFHSAWGMSEDGDHVTIGYRRTHTSQQIDGTGLIKIRNMLNEPDLDDLIAALQGIKEELRDLRPSIWPELRPIRKRIKKARF